MLSGLTISASESSRLVSIGKNLHTVMLSPPPLLILPPSIPSNAHFVQRLCWLSQDYSHSRQSTQNQNKAPPHLFFLPQNTLLGRGLSMNSPSPPSFGLFIWSLIRTTRRSDLSASIRGHLFIYLSLSLKSIFLPQREGGTVCAKTCNPVKPGLFSWGGVRISALVHQSYAVYVQ